MSCMPASVCVSKAIAKPIIVTLVEGCIKNRTTFDQNRPMFKMVMSALGSNTLSEQKIPLRLITNLHTTRLAGAEVFVNKFYEAGTPTLRGRVLVISGADSSSRV